MSCTVLLKYYHLGALMKINSKKQLTIDILTQYISGKLYYLDAIRSLDISERQFRRLVKEFKKDGIRSVIHKNTGKSPPNKISHSHRTKIIRLYKTIYKGMNITHFIEKLRNVEGLNPPSHSTVRKILLSEKLISPTMKRKRKSFPRRIRYEKEGIMVQIDGSHHRWLQSHEMICLTAAIDDATGKILGAKFTRTETTFAAMDVAEQIIKQYGLFQMLYSDKAGIYGHGKRDGYSNMNRAMQELGIIPVQANSPQAKGRIERLFKTLQSRLVQELRLAKVDSIGEANLFLKGYIKKFNEQFGVKAVNPQAGYRKLDNDINLDEVFSIVNFRKVQPGEIVSYKSKKYLINAKESLAGHDADIRLYRDGRMEIYVLGEKVKYSLFEEMKRVA
jgi:transposase InsO family protein